MWPALLMASSYGPLALLKISSLEERRESLLLISDTACLMTCLGGLLSTLDVDILQVGARLAVRAVDLVGEVEGHVEEVGDLSVGKAVTLRPCSWNTNTI